MPIKIPDALPASAVLLQENIACIESTQAEVQDIRALRILILNLMPLKIETEIHLLRMLSNSPLQVQIELLRIDDRASKNTPNDHMVSFYQPFEAIKNNKYDGMIITGAPLGQMAFEDVIFWPKLQEILDWTETNVTSTMFLCWAVQAAMFHFYGIDKRLLPQKLTGVYPHEVIRPQSPIARGFDDYFEAPHSRYAEVPIADIEAQPELHIIAHQSVLALTCSLMKPASTCSSRGTPNMNPTRLRTSIYATTPPDSPLLFLSTILSMMILTSPSK